MSLNRSGLVALALMLSCGPLLAHHGTAGTYDQQKAVEITGTVKEFIFRNPHSALILIGKDASGREVTYSLEISPPGSLARNGYTKNSFKPGDTISLKMHPAFNNPNVGEPVAGKLVLNGNPMRGVGGGTDPE